LLNKFNSFYGTALLCVQYLVGYSGQYKDYIRLRLESLDDTDDADNSMFVDFVRC